MENAGSRMQIIWVLSTCGTSAASSVYISYQSISISIEEFVTGTVVDGSSRIWGAGSRRAGWGGYTLRVVREVRWVFSRRLKVSDVFDCLIMAGNSFQIVGAVKLKERLLKLVVQKGIDKRFWVETRDKEFCAHCSLWMLPAKVPCIVSNCNFNVYLVHI